MPKAWKVLPVLVSYLSNTHYILVDIMSLMFARVKIYVAIFSADQVVRG
jgi:hypothetical protein